MLPLSLWHGFSASTGKKEMEDMAMFIGVFIMGYLLTMGLLYVILSVFPKRTDSSMRGAMKVSGNSKNGSEGLKGIEKSMKMKLANG